MYNDLREGSPPLLNVFLIVTYSKTVESRVNFRKVWL